LLTNVPAEDLNAMTLGLSHSLSRYKLKFSPDKVDTMIVQAVSLLDSLDKELNIFTMRVREWYGWHFPELGKIIVDHSQYCKAVKTMGIRTNASTTDFSEFLADEIESQVKDAAQVSMGTEITEEDIDNILDLATQVLDLQAYRAELAEYLAKRMQAIAPNLTLLLGDLIAARLIAHVGSLLALAKIPASSLQLLGAEKALFRALKTKHDTPKYGLIYHASLIGQAGNKNKGKISRALAAKASLSSRVDALSEKDDLVMIGPQLKDMVLARIRELESGETGKRTGRAKTQAVTQKYDPTKRGAAASKSITIYDTKTDIATDAMEIEITEPKKEKKKKGEKGKEGKEERKRRGERGKEEIER